jgi:hypothetical protein
MVALPEADDLAAASDVLVDAYRDVMIKAGKGVEHSREVARVLGTVRPASAGSE